MKCLTYDLVHSRLGPVVSAVKGFAQAEEISRCTLCICGSYVSGRMDDWSDVDLVLMGSSPQERTIERIRKWQSIVRGVFEPEVRADPTWLTTGEAYQDYANCVLYSSLREHSRVLFGSDVRHRIPEAPLHQLRLSVIDAGLGAVRLLYGVGADIPLASALSPRKLEEVEQSHGRNLAWTVFKAVTHLVRACLVLKGGSLCYCNWRMGNHLRHCGEHELGRTWDGAMEMRARVSRWDPTREVPRVVQSVAECVPALYGLLTDEMVTLGLRDPTYGHQGGCYYNPDGTPREEAQGRAPRVRV